MPHNTFPTSRLSLLSWSAFSMVSAIWGLFLWSLLLTSLCLAPIWIGIPFTLWVAQQIHTYGAFHYRWATRSHPTAKSMPTTYIQRKGSTFERFKAILVSQTLWREQWWLLVNGVSGAFFGSCVVGTFVYGLFCLAFPYIYTQVPHGAVNDTWIFFKVHSQASAFFTIPYGIIVLIIWWMITPLCMRAYAQSVRTNLSNKR